VAAALGLAMTVLIIALSIFPIVAVKSNASFVAKVGGTSWPSTRRTVLLAHAETQSHTFNTRRAFAVATVGRSVATDRR
jgi:DMSO/TMAO reductase YedYZ heme-binding membrane subunit